MSYLSSSAQILPHQPQLVCHPFVTSLHRKCYCWGQELANKRQLKIKPFWKFIQKYAASPGTLLIVLLVSMATDVEELIKIKG